MVDVIDPDEEAAWPSGVISLLIDNEEVIRAYEEQEQKLDLLSSSLWLAAGSPRNSFRGKREALISRIHDMISDSSIVGYHATRLTESERSALEGSSLDVLSIDLVSRRLSQAVADGYLSPEMASTLGSTSRASDGNRSGMVWMIFFKSLARTDGLYRLFRYWGGEATYLAHEETEIGETLKGIGSPCLLKCEVPISDLHPFDPIASRFIAAFMERRGLRCVNGYEFETYSCMAVHVSRIIAWGQQEFDDLTCHHDWHTKLS